MIMAVRVGSAELLGIRGVPRLLITFLNYFNDIKHCIHIPIAHPGLGRGGPGVRAEQHRVQSRGTIWAGYQSITDTYCGHTHYKQLA